MSVLFYTVKLSYGRWFVKYVDAETDRELEPAMWELTHSAYMRRLIDWSAVPTAVRYANTVGVFVEQFPTQSSLYQLRDAFNAQLHGRHY